ncbi:protein tyrosine kinase [Heterostelium album PN500]|uniref:Protein tyrosine kinase n=1 Tax=Heterostelium pallidum (strain ATCC 26659 / Pp 5 / PN500) TaxID=670386 RepID=D3BUS9_HETP5|nr:protein tyrosine kinase [Heterostelium album PN500]EFA74867.1 protein tyrosine kinase [Heterostelium album PN500]|eukprot:XP_020427001.1 protein tyrosine kinase [Heterostelium album PN500]
MGQQNYNYSTGTSINQSFILVLHLFYSFSRMLIQQQTVIDLPSTTISSPPQPIQSNNINNSTSSTATTSSIPSTTNMATVTSDSSLTSASILTTNNKQLLAVAATENHHLRSDDIGLATTTISTTSSFMLLQQQQQDTATTTSTCTINNHPITINTKTICSIHTHQQQQQQHQSNNINDEYPLYLSDNENSGDCCCPTTSTSVAEQNSNSNILLNSGNVSLHHLNHLSSRENGDSWMEENFSCAEDFDEMLVFTDDVESEREKRRYTGVANRSRSNSLMSNCTGTSSINNIFEGSLYGSSFNNNNINNSNNHFSVIQSAITAMQNTPLLTQQQQLRLSPTLNDLLRLSPTNTPTSPPQMNRTSTPTTTTTTNNNNNTHFNTSPTKTTTSGRLNSSSNFIPITNCTTFSLSPPTSPKKNSNININNNNSSNSTESNTSLNSENNNNNNNIINNNNISYVIRKRRSSVPTKPLMTPLDFRSIRRSSEDNPIASDIKVMEKIRVHKKDLESMKLKHVKLKQQMSLLDEGYTEVQYLSDDEDDEDNNDNNNESKPKLEKQCKKLEIDINNLENLLSLLSTQSNFGNNNNNNNNNNSNSNGITHSTSGSSIGHSASHQQHHHHSQHVGHMHSSCGSNRSSTSPRTRDWRDWTNVTNSSSSLHREWTNNTSSSCSCGIGCSGTGFNSPSSKKFSQELKLELRPLEIRAAVHTSPRRLNTSQINSNNNNNITNSNGINQSSSSITNFFDDTISEFEVEKTKLDQYQFALAFKQKEPIDYQEYTIKRKLGEGKHSVIWEVMWRETRFALKQYKQPQPGQSNDLSKEESMKYILGINHYNVMVGIGYTVQPHQCLLLEYMEGTTLYDLLIKDGVKIEMPMFLKIGKELAAAMNHLHSMEIIHGNLTIDSIYVDKLGNVKVGGIKYNSSDPNDPAIDPRYRAPEIIKSQAITTKVDFNDGTTVAVKVSFENLRPKIPMRCPLIIRKLINRCWSPNSESRPDFTEILRIFYHLDGKIFFSALARGSLWVRYTLDQDQEIERERKRREKYDEILEFLQKRDYIVEFNDLQFGEKIGEGSFAKVWLGEWNGYKVAIKKLKNPNITEKFFLREVSNLIKSHHPNVVMFMGIVTNPPCIITEYMSGGSLYDVLHSKHCNLDKTMMFKMMRDLAIGMSHLHSLSPPMLHRDLTSKNILLDEFQNIKISDFGLSKQIEEEMTLAGICNPRWRPPEITKGMKNYCEKVDVYSFGLVIYEIYTGKVPFENLEGVTAAAKSAYENLRPSLPDDCPLWLRKLITRCWAGEPSERPSFLEIVNILNQYKDQFIKRDLFEMISGDDENDQIVEDNIHYDDADES